MLYLRMASVWEGVLSMLAWLKKNWTRSTTGVLETWHSVSKLLETWHSVSKISKLSKTAHTVAGCWIWSITGARAASLSPISVLSPLFHFMPVLTDHVALLLISDLPTSFAIFLLAGLLTLEAAEMALRGFLRSRAQDGCPLEKICVPVTLF